MHSNHAKEQELVKLKNTKDDDDASDHQNDRLATLIANHESRLSKTKSVMDHVAVGAFSLSFTFALRQNILILYLQTFEGYKNGDYTDSNIAILIYLSYLSFASFAYIYGILGDKWRFDYLIIIASIIDVIAFFIEASCQEFLLFSIGYIIGGQPIQSLMIGFINKLLPIYDAKQSQILLIQCYFFGYSIGPITGGIVSYYTNYNIVFYLSAIIATFLFQYLLVYIIVMENSQSKLITMQQNLANCKNSDCIDLIDHLGQDHILPLVSQTKNINKIANSSDEEKNANFNYSLCLIMAMEGLVLSAESGLFAWYAAYMDSISDNYNYNYNYNDNENGHQELKQNSNIIAATGHTGILAAFLVVGTRLVLKLIKQMQDKRNQDINNDNTSRTSMNSKWCIHASNKYDCCNFLILNVACGSIFCCLINVLAVVVIESTSLHFWIYFGWIYMILYGIVVGFIYTSCDALLIELMPKKLAGKGFGTKFAIQYVFKGIAPFIIGIFWQHTCNSLFYVQSFCYVVIFALVICFCLLSQRKN